MIRLTALLLISISSLKAFSQVEIPSGINNCKTLNTNNFWYCVDESDYQTVWTAIKIEKSNIENRQFFPPDKDFFPDISKFEHNNWTKLENQAKFWALEFDSVFVVTGLVNIQDSSKKQPIKYFYKAILKGCKGDAIGFLMNNDSKSGDLLSFAVPVDSLEHLTGLDFFSVLNPDLQTIIESEFNTDFWQVSIP